MSKISDDSGDLKDEAGDRLSRDLDGLKNSFAQMREDVTKLLEHALDTGKHGAGVVKDRASSAVSDVKDCLGEFKDRGVDSIEQIGQKIGENPLASTAIAFGIGFILAKLLSKR
jgi:ElaB/YqjD/DUF883 family membrane-anchored ribosome-binding protein